MSDTTRSMDNAIVQRVHTPKEMSIYRYTMLNAGFWSFMIIVHIGLLVRPLVLDSVCVITGLVKQFGPFIGGNLQFVFALILLLNKTTAYTLCLATNVCAFRFPLLARQITLRQGVFIYLFFHTSLSGILLASAYYSKLLTSVVSTNVTKIDYNVDKDFYHELGSLQPLLDNSLVIQIPRQYNNRRTFTGTFLILLLFQIIFTVFTAIYATFKITRSIQLSHDKHQMHYKKRLRRILLIRTSVPTFSYHFPCFFAILMIHYEDDSSLLYIQWFMLLIFASPAFCSVFTIGSLPQYRRAFKHLISFKFLSVFHRHNESESESSNSKPRNNVIYTTDSFPIGSAHFSSEYNAIQ
ncbi:hypothetical protein M3Y98_00149800 [Aphelenchoides besseyi]|nr:hypothetical protein M3Y98_00149800 [Aphelenchoides besseyi]KAI6199788.1 hypothetical protein M3Y96_00664200 [Aphelenchoides besseyi]